MNADTLIALFIAILSLLTLLFGIATVWLAKKNKEQNKIIRAKVRQSFTQNQALVVHNQMLKKKLQEAQNNPPLAAEPDKGDVAIVRRTKEGDVWLEKVYTMINENYTDPEFTTSVAAKSLYLSDRSFQRKFKDLTGRTFIEYLNKVRLKNASKLLKSGMKVSDVALASGFNDPSYFSRRFRNRYGVPPSKYTG